MEHDARTPDEEARLSRVLWWELHGPVQDGRLLSWDRPITPKKRRSTKVAVKCGRCDGKGAIACFSAQYSGKCFACGGSGFRLISEATWKKQQALRKAHDAHFAAAAGTPITWNDLMASRKPCSSCVTPDQCKEHGCADDEFAIGVNPSDGGQQQ